MREALDRRLPLVSPLHTHWLGHLIRENFRSFSVVNKVGTLACLQKDVEGKHFANVIFFSQGKELLFDKVSL